jgi:two-component system chemotaxis response regulator CheB
MASSKIRVLVVDDSALMREIIGDFIKAAPDMELAATAPDGLKALALAESLRPDVVTLDIQMPQMDGLETLTRLLQRSPLPVVMVSSLTQLGASITLDALERGAMDYIGKPDSAAAVAATLGEELLRKIRAIAGTDVGRILRIRQERKARQQAAAPRAAEPAAEAAQFLADKCIAVGISTGGPPALTSIFEGLRPPLPPIVVVQHMPPNFTAPFAWRLNSISKLNVKEAAAGDVLQPNCAYIAPGGLHTALRAVGSQVKIVIHDRPPVSGHRPSADVLMTSAAHIYGPRCLGIIMTGMGRDGADGCGAIRAAGGYVLGQDEASSDVYGMNKVAFVEGHVDRQFSLDDGAIVIHRTVKQLWAPEPAAV